MDVSISYTDALIFIYFLRFYLAYKDRKYSLSPIERLFWGEQQPVVAFAAAGCIFCLVFVTCLAKKLRVRLLPTMESIFRSALKLSKSLLPLRKGIF